MGTPTRAAEDAGTLLIFEFFVNFNFSLDKNAFLWYIYQAVLKNADAGRSAALRMNVRMNNIRRKP